MEWVGGGLGEGQAARFCPLGGRKSEVRWLIQCHREAGSEAVNKGRLPGNGHKVGNGEEGIRMRGAWKSLWVPGSGLLRVRLPGGQMVPLRPLNFLISRCPLLDGPNPALQ